MSDKGGPLPKFGEWNVNDPASAERFTVIFNKARDEKKTGGNPRGPESPGKEHGSFAKSNSKKWFCCLQPHKVES
ncbi:RPM1-interacting protein 4 [Amborella trichopoda]|uniref:RPM1-interacting protein 4 n=1 Tax=Amborella trichopoda TaxID=13333 RepID=UPI0005D42FAE|nr:RPM1-interacting protein 4 [Amborella trichopoda]|eukprot:XP_011628269.1 RPM1-interacting protein 4 [Amborella trichopoda]